MTAFSPTTKVRIRPMQTSDLEQVRDIDRLSFSMPWPESAYRYELNENPRSLLWVAENIEENGEKQVVGSIVVWLILDEAHIAAIAVHPYHRGRGIGRKLLVTALRASIQKGSHSATLEVRANNLIAQNLYRHFRFKVTGNRPRYYRDNNEDALIMTVNNLGDAYLEWLESEAGNDPLL